MPYAFHERTLPNGLTVIAELDPSAHSSSVGFFVKTGARDEDPRVMGVSHFLEHMMFKGTSKRTSDDVNREFDAMGARANAYTSAEMTAFHAAMLPEFLPKAIDLLADMMRPALREEDFATEKGVILEEIAMYKDDPVWVLYEKLLEEHFRNHTLAHRVLGTEQTITDLTATQMREYFQHRYSADNTVVALAGKVDFDRAVDQLSTLCGHWQVTKAQRSYIDPQFAPRAVNVRDDRVARAYRMLLAPGPAHADPRRYAAFVLAQALGGPDNSRLHWSLVETGLAEAASCDFDPRDGVGDLRVFVACEPQHLDEAWAITLREIATLKDNISEADVERIRAKVATGVTLAGEQPDGRMHRLGRQWMYQRQYTTLAQELDRINRVTVANVRDLLDDFPFSPAAVGTLTP
jgi:predicted Zn-dependent peptidase